MRSLRFLCCSGIIALLLAGCATSKTVTVTPQVGNYVGEPGVSFDVTDKGLIQNFKITIKLGGGNCGLEFKQDKTFEVGPDGSFVIMGKQPKSNNKPLPMNTILGKFDTPTSVAGTYSDTFECAIDVTLKSNEPGSWHAGLAPTPAPDRTQELLIRELTASAWVSTLTFTPDGKTLVLGLDNGDLELLNVTNGTNIQILDNRGTSIDSIVFSPDQTLMAVARDFATAQDPPVKVWRTSDWSTVNTMDVLGTKSASFSPDGSLLASGSRVGDVNIWKVSDWSLLSTFKGHEGVVTSLAFSPDGMMLASGAADDSIRIWKVSDGTLIRSLEPKGGSIFGDYSYLAFLDNGTTLAGVHNVSDIKMYFWKVTDGTLLRNINTDAVFDLAFSPDRKFFVSSSFHDQVQIWQVSDGALIATMTDVGARSVAFSPDGKMVASVSGNRVRLWKVKNPQ